jgi:hypothetical protein
VRLTTNDLGFIQIVPDADDIVVNATAAVDVIDGTRLHEVWPQIVTATHPDYSPFTRTKIDAKIFMPLDLERFMAVRCRAVSSLEKWGPNINGDGFPSQELQSAFQTLIAKGFYIEHQSFDPRNAIGIIAHAEWVPAEEYVLTAALIDKIRFPRQAQTIKERLANKRAGVSIGCIAGEAECSICGNVAKKKFQLCAHMNREHPQYVKGRKQTNGGTPYDICRNLLFYELSYTAAPADRDALSFAISGSTTRFAEEEKGEQAAPAEGEKPAAAPALPIPIGMPDVSVIEKWVNRAVSDAFTTRYKKLVKDEVYRQLEDFIKKQQLQIRPVVKDIVEEKKEGLPQPQTATA